jgi:hypothetical protein
MTKDSGTDSKNKGKPTYIFISEPQKIIMGSATSDAEPHHFYAARALDG